MSEIAAEREAGFEKPGASADTIAIRDTAREAVVEARAAARAAIANYEAMPGHIAVVVAQAEAIVDIGRRETIPAELVPTTSTALAVAIADTKEERQGALEAIVEAILETYRARVETFDEGQLAAEENELKRYFNISEVQG